MPAWRRCSRRLEQSHRQRQPQVLDARRTHETQRSVHSLHSSDHKRADVSCSDSGHKFIDILKIDIEGGEFDAVTAFLSAHAESDVLPVGQLQLEIHARDGRENFEYFSRWWATLEAAGLRPFWTEPNLVYINIVRGARPELAEVRLSLLVFTLVVVK